MADILGSAVTRYGRINGESSLSLMAQAARGALHDAGLERESIDGLVCGYSLGRPHIMWANVFAEYFGLQPRHARCVQVGGATGAAMLIDAARLVDSGACRRVLVVAGENRLSGQSRDASVAALAQVGEAEFEVPYGATVPAYYALFARRYLHQFGGSEASLAQLAVLMRRHARAHPAAHLREPLTVDSVLASKTIAAPLKLGDCCPISDGAAALVVGRGGPVTIAGCGEAHPQQHVSWLAECGDTGAGRSSGKALESAGLDLTEIDLALIYDSFTITLAALLEEIGFAPRGEAGALAAAGQFDLHGKLPLNPHGGLLSFGHSGVAGGMAHLVEAVAQLRGRAGARQCAARCALVHADGGVLSSHASLILRAT